MSKRKPTERTRQGAIHLLCYAAPEDYGYDVAATELGFVPSESAEMERLAAEALDEGPWIPGEWPAEDHYLYAAELLLNGWSPR